MGLSLWGRLGKVPAALKESEKYKDLKMASVEPLKLQIYILGRLFSDFLLLFTQHFQTLVVVI